MNEFFNSSLFIVDKYANDIILDTVVGGMLDGSKEISIKAVRTLSFAFLRSYSLQDNADDFIRLFSKMATDENGTQESRKIGVYGIISVIDAVEIFGDVRPSFADALGIITDASSTNDYAKEFLTVFWNKYEGTLTSSGVLALSPLKKSIKEEIE